MPIILGVLIIENCILFRVAEVLLSWLDQLVTCCGGGGNNQTSQVTGGGVAAVLNTLHVLHSMNTPIADAFVCGASLATFSSQYTPPPDGETCTPARLLQHAALAISHSGQ